MEENILEINIELLQNTSLDDAFVIKLKDNNGKDFEVKETFVSKRIASNQVQIGSTLKETVSNLNRSLILDYQNEFVVESHANGARINAHVDRWQFIDTVLTPNLPILITPEVLPYIPFEITNVEFVGSAINSCENVKVQVMTSLPMTSYCINEMCVNHTESFVEFEVTRSSLTSFKVRRGLNVVTQQILAPTLLSSFFNQITIDLINTSNGTTATINVPAASTLDLEYSLDGINWQESNVFSGLDLGNYTAFIKDNLGCQKQKEFTVLTNNFGDPVVFISKENSIRFIHQVINYRNDENRPFCRSTATLNYGYIQEFLPQDIITTQFKSNYENIQAKVHNITDNTINILPVLKQSNFIGLKAKYSGVKRYRISTTQFGIYFETGNILDYQTNSIIDTFNLNGSLPIWAKIGNVIKIGSASYIIQSIGFDENRNAEVLIFNGIAPIIADVVTVECVYNLQDYEVYEFDVNMSNYINKDFKVYIHNTDPNFDDFTYESEVISVSEDLKSYLEIRYYNSTNTNVLYSTGIKHLLRLPYNTIKANDSDTNESYNSDTNTHLLDSKVYEITDFEFMPFPLELYRKLKIALSMDIIYIDGVGYTKNSEFNKENLGETNLYKLTASMIKNGFVYNSNIEGSEFIEIDNNVNITGLISVEQDGYIAL